MTLPSRHSHHHVIRSSPSCAGGHVSLRREEEQQRGITMKSSAISLLHTKELRRRVPEAGAPGKSVWAEEACTTTGDDGVVVMVGFYYTDDPRGALFSSTLQGEEGIHSLCVCVFFKGRLSIGTTPEQAYVHNIIPKVIHLFVLQAGALRLSLLPQRRSPRRRRPWQATQGKHPTLPRLRPP